MKRGCNGFQPRSLVHHLFIISRSVRFLAGTCILIFLFPFLLLGCSEGKRTGLSPGDRAPEVSGEDLQGLPRTLHSIKAKVVLVNFWATWCGPCIIELPALQSLYSQLKDEGLEIVGVVLDDTAESVAPYQKKNGITYPIIIDSKGDSKQPYGINGLPESFILDGEGRVVMVPDPGNGQPVTRLIGPRDWTSPATVALFRSLLKK